MAFPTFSKATMTTLTISRGNVFPTTHAYQPVQRISRSYAGNFQVATIRAPDETFTLQFQGLVQADYDALVAWFTDTRINWGANSFTYTDTAGVATIVRYVGGGLAMPQVASGLYSLSIDLIKDQW